jgi:hypothetical protein
MGLINYTLMYLFIISIVFLLKMLFDVVMNINNEVTELKISKSNKVFILLTFSYFVTYIIGLIIT